MTPSLPDSIFEKSRMSLMMDRSASPAWAMPCEYSRISGFSSSRRIISFMPSSALIGVRISWLMFARNALFCRLARSENSFSRRSASLSAAFVRMMNR